MCINNSVMETVLCSVAVVFSLCVCGLFLYKKVRPYFPVKVNCWFCDKNTTVPFGNQNCWDCPHCEQYNGFEENGDYNKPIPAQYDESLNFPMTCAPSKFSTKTDLCLDCIRNQQIKIKLLSEFVPFNEESFSEEVDSYRQHLEKAYQLCKWCEFRAREVITTLDNDLKKSLPLESFKASCADYILQPLPSDSWQNRHVHIHGLIVTSFLCLTALLITGIFEFQEDRGQRFVAITWMTISYLPTASILTVAGLLTAVGGILLAGRHRLQSADALVAFLWVGIQAIYSSFISNWIPTSDLYMIRPVIVFSTLLCSVTSYFLKLTFTPCNRLTPRRRIKKNTISSAIYNKPSNASDPSATFQKNSWQKPSNDVLDTIDQKFDAIRITTNETSNTGIKGLKSLQRLQCKPLRCQYPLIKPPLFTSKSFNHVSWTGATYWSYSGEKSAPSIGGCSSLGLLTPPPSVCSSQESSSASPAESICGEEWHDSREAKILTWPPSVGRDRLLQWELDTSGSSYHTSNSSSVSQQKLPQRCDVKLPVSRTSFLKSLCSFFKLAIFSIIVNITLLTYFVILPCVDTAK